MSKTKQLVMSIDDENGVKYIPLSSDSVAYSVSAAEDGKEKLDKIGADVVLDFNETGKLVGIELFGL